MTLRRLWVARCDEPGCTAMIVAETTDMERWEAGQMTNDAGWDARPSTPETWCPLHWKGERYDS